MIPLSSRIGIRNRVWKGDLTWRTVEPVTMTGSSPVGPDGLGDGGREFETLTMGDKRKHIKIIWSRFSVADC